MPVVVAQAATALGKSGQEAAVLPLIRTLENRQRTVQFMVVEALLELGPLSIAPLQKVRETECDPKSRQLMSLILEQLERMKNGLAPVETGILLDRSSEIIDEIIGNLR
jgi:HEAT repeat protein